MASTELKTILQACLCPAGDGVYTVGPGSAKKNTLQKLLYGGTGEVAQNGWHDSLQALDDVTEPLLLGVCSDTGGGIARGANWGPLYTRMALYRHTLMQVHDMGDVRVNPHLLSDKYLNDATLKTCRKSFYGEENAPFPVSPLSITEAVAGALFSEYPDKRLLTLGGDHSISYPLVKAYLQTRKQQGKRVAVIHFDAHTDLLEERLGIDICFGSWATHILPFLQTPDDLIQLGLRASQKDKSYWTKKYGVQQYWAHEFSETGVKPIMQQVVKNLQSKAVDEIYVSFDIDAIDSRYVMATGTPEEKGITPEDALLALRQLGRYFTFGAMDLVEVAPLISHLPAEFTSRGHYQDVRKTALPQPETTLQVAADIAEALIMNGKR